MSRSRTSRATSASVRPTSRPARDLADDAVGGLRGEPQQGDLVGVLDHPQLAQDATRPSSYVARAARVAACSRSRCSASIVSDRPIRGGRSRAASTAAATSAYGSSVSSQVADLDRRPQAGLRRAALQPRHDDERVLARLTSTSMVSRSSGIAS